MLQGKVAIVTGASSGFGEAISKSLAREGVKVVLAARREDRLKEVEKNIKERGGEAICVKTDVTNSDEVAVLVKETERRLGTVDILVNNAGALFITEMRNNNVAEANRQIDVNCKGVTYCVGAVLEGMVQRKSGHIVNISSDSGRRARKDWDESTRHRIMSADDVARAVVYAVSQPDYLCVNELLIQPRDEYV